MTRSMLLQELIDMRWVIAKDQPKEVLSTMRTPELGPRMSELNCPILTFWGADDEFMPPQGKEKCLKANQKSTIYRNKCLWSLGYDRAFTNV